MSFLNKISCLLLASLMTLSVMAQEVPVIKADTTAVEDEFVMPKDAPYFSGAEDKMYHLRKVNIHGVKHINHDIIRSSSGLVPGDSIFLSGSFIQNAMMRLWSQRYFEDIQIGATIEGDSVDLEVMLRERPRVMNWAVAGVPKGKGKDLIDETLKLKRGHELSDHIIDRNIKLLKEHFGEKGFLDCEVDVKIEPDSVIKQAVNVTFDVKKNQRIRIGEILFEGNENFDDKRLARTFKKTHKVSPLFWQNHRLALLKELTENFDEYGLSRFESDAHPFQMNPSATAFLGKNFAPHQLAHCSKLNLSDNNSAKFLKQIDHCLPNLPFPIAIIHYRLLSFRYKTR